MTGIRQSIPRLKDSTASQILKLSEKTIGQTKAANTFFESVADAFLFILRVIKESFNRHFEFRELFSQCFQIGTRSLPLISITGIIMGLVLTIQSRPVLANFGAVSMLPGMVIVSMVREMAPVITALICAGKIGSGIGAELGSMKVTEQIEAMEVSATNPMRFLVVPRVWASTLMIPLLVLYSAIFGFMGSWVGANIKGDVSFVLFSAQAFRHLEFVDFIPSVIKSFFFGAVIGFVGCYKGFNAGRGTESVGIAANSAVVTASFMVIIVDLIAVQITDMFI